MNSFPIRFPLRALFYLAISLSLALSGLARESPAAAGAQIQKSIRERLDAYAKGDVQAWSRYIDADAFLAGSTRADLQKEISARPSAIKNWYGEVRDFTVREHGEVAIAHYRIIEFTEIGGQRLEADEWRTETYVRQAGSWLLLAGTHAVIPRDPTVAKIDSRVLDAYVGEYEYAPGTRDTVTREGNRLFLQATGQGKEEIFPEDEKTFFGRAQDWRVIFAKDKRGKVVSLIFRQNAQDLVARRLPTRESPN